MKNKRGETPFDLLKKISEKLNNNNYNNPSSNEKEYDYDNDWNDELAEDTYADYMFDTGKYEQDYFYADNTYEPHGDWADRIGREYRKRKRVPPPAPPPSSSSSGTKRAAYRTDAEDRAFRDKHARAMLQFYDGVGKVESSYALFKRRSSAFDARVRLLRSDERIGERDIPWLMPLDSDPLVAMVSTWARSSCGGEGDCRDAVRAELKLLRVAWHPDRFLLRCGCFIDDGDRARIIQRVVAVSQAINAALSGL